MAQNLKSALAQYSQNNQKNTGIDEAQALAILIEKYKIVDILAAAGIKIPDISILSDEFLDEVQQMERKNLALEALRKLINDGIRSRCAIQRAHSGFG